MRVLKILLVSALLLKVSIGFLYAQEVDLPSQRIYPDSIFYPVKRGFEKIREKLIFSEDGKQKYYLKLFKNRLSELDYVTDNKLADDIEKSSGRVSASAGMVSVSVSKEGYTNKEQGLTSVFSEYSKHLEIMRDRYPSGTAEWRFVQQNIDTLDILSNKLRD